jgi:hypothetical protein
VSLIPPTTVAKLQATLHAKAKGSACYRFAAMAGRTGGRPRTAPSVVVPYALCGRGRTHSSDAYPHRCAPQPSEGERMSPCPRAGCGKSACPVR